MFRESHNRFDHRCQIAVWLISSGVLGLGFFVILGWLLDLDTLKGVLPGLPTMKVNTALCLMLGSISLALAQKTFLCHVKNWRRGYRFLSFVAAGLMIWLGGLTLAQYGLGVDLNVDQWLVLQPEPTGSMAAPGRMAPNTAFTFVLLGIALIWVHSSLLGLGSQIIVLLAAHVGFVALIGYLYKTTVLYGVGSDTGMAIHTALGTIALSVGVLCLFPNRGWLALFWDSKLGSVMLRQLLPIVIMAQLSIGLFAEVAQIRNYYGVQASSAVATTLSLLLLSVLITWKAHRLNTLNAIEIQTRQRLEASQQRLSGILDNANDAIITTDQNQRIILFNRGAESLFGYSVQEVIGQPINLLIPERFHTAHTQHVETFGRSQQFSVVKDGGREIFGRRQDGSEFPAMSSVSSQDIQGETLFTVFLRDITDLKKAEKALKIYSENLEIQVKERTEELSKSLLALQKSEEHLSHLAHHDTLTGLPNRLMLHIRLEQSIQQASRQRTKVAIAFIDLDHFKRINDSLGHQSGDSILQQVALRWRQILRANDSLARISGDEFVLILVDIENFTQVSLALARLMAALETPFQLIGQTYPVHVTASIGVSLFPDNGLDASILLRNADTAMYRAKEEGRNTYRFYTGEMTTAAFEYMWLANALREALNRDELRLVYQPQIDLQSQNWVGCEALLRWQHPDRGHISPVEFIPIAEQSGLIQEIGVYVLKKACTQARVWLDDGVNIGRIAVNISAAQLQDPDFVRVVKAALGTSGLPPQCLELEVTEGTLMGRAESNIDQLEQLRKMGIHIAVDDFGTGYSSLSYLKQLPIDKLKIDRAFVRDIPKDTNDMAICSAILALGQALDIRIIAEGVETSQQADFLRSKNCHEAQGYLYSKPIEAEDIKHLFLGL
jgi:diguanylate cyclase (GGDEF)-like protein/PAS domain S-box-containing protein